MFTVTGIEDASDLTFDDLWHALQVKAEEPMPFVPAISDCAVVERGPDYLIRDIVLRGENVRERVTFLPSRKVHFERLSGAAMGTIDNEIEGDEEHGLRLRFTFCLSVDGLVHGSQEEREFAEMMGGSYLAAIRATLKRAREMTLVGGAQ